MKEFELRAQAWLNGEGFDHETKMKVRQLINGDPAELEDAFYKNLEFGTGGLRGIMGVGTNRMNKYTVGMATQGLANYILSHYEGDDPKNRNCYWTQMPHFMMATFLFRHLPCAAQI